MATDTRRKTVAEIAGDYLLERRKLVGDAAAERRGRPTGAESLSKREERAAFWQRFLTVEQEAALLQQGQTRLQVSAAVYKRRWELWEKKGELPARLAWAREMAELGPPDGMEQPIEAPSSAAADQPQEPPEPVMAEDGRYDA